VLKAERVERLIAPVADPNNDEHAGYMRLLQGEIALAKGDTAAAAKLFDLQDPRYGGSVESISTEALPRMYARAGQTDAAITLYERLLRPGLCRLAGWEPQQRCDDARLALATAYLARGDKSKASTALAPLLNDWKDADPALPLKKQAVELASRLSN
jgi:tetratricopeptide (TPR) repeat protein